MPPKIRELIVNLEQAGFVDRGDKGSHRNFVHPKVARPVTVSGNPGDDANWDTSFAGSLEVLDRLADEAIADHRAGRTKPIDPDTM